MFMPGLRRTSEPSAAISRPCRAAMARTAPGSQVEASAVPHGRREAVAARRMPEGPSVVMAGGTPRERRRSLTPPKAPALPGAPSGESISMSP